MLKVVNWFSLAFFFLVSVPTIGLALIFIVNNLGDSQTQIFVLDLLILSCMEAVLLIIEMCVRDRSHFKSIIQSLPYLRKFRKYQ